MKHIVAVLLLGSLSLAAQTLFDRSLRERPAELLLQSVPAVEQAQLALPQDGSRSDRTQAVTFTNLFRSSFTNITYFFSSVSPIAYEPRSGVLGIIEHVVQDNRATGGDLGSQLVFRYSTNRGGTWLRQVLVNNSSTFYGVPQIALSNPDNVTTPLDLKVCLSGYRYPKQTNYYRSGTAIFVRIAGQVSEYNELGPLQNNPRNYYFGDGRLTGFSTSSDRSGFALCGILSPPNNDVQYGQYGSLVINAQLQDLNDFIGTIPDTWDYTVFRSTGQRTSTYNSPMYVDADADGNLYAVINAVFANDENNRVVAVSKSTDMGQTWSSFERMPTSVLQAYASTRGAAIAAPFRVYDQHAMVVTGRNRFSYIQRVALFADQNTLSAVDLVETEYDNGTWTMRFIAPINDIPTVYSYNDSATQARNYQQLVCDEVISRLGNEVEAARTADGTDLIVKWIDAVPGSDPVVIQPPQVVLQYDQQSGAYTGETTVDSLPVFNVFIASRSLTTNQWSNPVNITADRYFYKGTHIPNIVPSRTQIPLLVLRSLASTEWNQQSDAGRLLARSPQDFVNRIFDIPHNVAYALVSATLSTEPRNDGTQQVHIAVSPSPATENIEVAIGGMARSGQLALLDMLGRQIAIKQLLGGDGIRGVTFDVQSLPAGVYLVQLRTGGQPAQTVPVVVAH